MKTILYTSENKRYDKNPRYTFEDSIHDEAKWAPLVLAVLKNSSNIS